MANNNGKNKGKIMGKNNEKKYWEQMMGKIVGK